MSHRGRAKDPKPRLSDEDDEDIVRLRDDPADPGRVQALGIPGVRRALAESRLRALAFALESKEAAQAEVE